MGEFSGGLESQCYALEPVPHLFAAIPETPRIRKFPYAIGAECESINLYLSTNRECNSIDKHIAEGEGLGEVVECRAITLEAFLRENDLQGRVHLLKVDIEGAEKLLFASTSDETLRSLPQVTIEFHDFVTGSTDGPFVAATIDRMRRLGFVFVPYSFLMPEAKHADVLFIRPKACGLTFAQRCWLACATGLLYVQNAKAAVLTSMKS